MRSNEKPDSRKGDMLFTVEYGFEHSGRGGIVPVKRLLKDYDYIKFYIRRKPRVPRQRKK